MSSNGGGNPATPRPAPMIGKVGPYTVFVTPPPESPNNNKPNTPKKQSPPPPDCSFKKSDSPVQSPPPVLPPPVHYNPQTDASPFAFFWNALAKVQNAHSSLDGYVAHWFGLNQSKYQWALDDYYESKGLDQLDATDEKLSTKAERV